MMGMDESDESGVINQLQKIWLGLLLLIIGVVAFSAYDSLRRESENWREQAQNQANVIQGIWQDWLHSNEKTLLSATIVYEASSQVTNNEFFDLVENLEYSWEQNRTIELAVVKVSQSQNALSLEATSLITDNFRDAASFLELSEVKDAIKQTFKKDATVLSRPIFLKGGGWVGVMARKVQSPYHKNIVIVNLVNLGDKLKNLFSTKVDKGLWAEMSIQQEHDEKYITLPHASSPMDVGSYIYESKIVGMGAIWNLHWYVSQEFRGGPDIGKFKIFLIWGVLIVVLVLFFGHQLISKVREVKYEGLRRQKAEDELKKIAHYDAVTGLPNRFFTLQKLEQYIDEDDGTALLSVSFIDLDDFKIVNDTFGHHAGDVLLCMVAKRISSILGKGDILGRIGGDEFILLLKTKDVDELNNMMASIRGFFTETFLIDEYVIHCGSSIGIATYPDCGDSPEKLLRHADHAMFLAKQSGKSQFRYFDSDIDQAIRQKKERVVGIKKAIDNKEFILHYQPKLDFVTGEVYGCEALIRWQCPGEGLIPPGGFLPLIENTDMDIRLGYYVINMALKQMQTWQDHGLDLEVSVNVSPALLQDEKFVKKVTALLQRYADVPAHLLQFEILETVALNDINHIRGILHECMALGISFALDDFGTGFSSLSYLNDIPAKIVKIDRSFVMTLHEDESKGQGEIIKAIVELTKIFHRSVVAEGVENIAQGNMLISFGCTHAQGFFIARPMASDELPVWIKSYRMPNEWKKRAQALNKPA